MGTAQVVMYGLLVILIATGTYLGLSGALGQKEDAVRNEMVSNLSLIGGKAEAWRSVPTGLRGEGTTPGSTGFEDFTIPMVFPDHETSEDGGYIIGNAKYTEVTVADSALSIDAESISDPSVKFYLRIPGRTEDGRKIYSPSTF